MAKLTRNKRNAMCFLLFIAIVVLLKLSYSVINPPITRINDFQYNDFIFTTVTSMRINILTYFKVIVIKFLFLQLFVQSLP
jgi:hypothetical protein